MAILMTLSSFGQIGSSIDPSRRVPWNNFGYGTIPETYGVTLNVKTLGAVGNGIVDDTPIIQNAINSANPNVLTVIYFPAGKYKITSTISITKNKIVLKGAGPSYTSLLCYNGAGIDISGTESSDSAVGIIAGNQKGSTVLTLASASNIQTGDYIEIRRNMDPATICDLPDAQFDCQSAVILNPHYYGQVVKVKYKYLNTITLEDGLSMGYDLSTFRAIKLNPVSDVGVQDLTLKKISGSSYSIRVIIGVRIWISGIESDYTTLHHIGIIRSTKVEVRGCYIHAMDPNMGGNGGYGVYIGERSTNCLVEDNTFDALRHSVLLSGSSSRNVVGYNYNGSNVNTEYVLHGFYPHSNLFEGNIGGTMDIDETWGLNGIYNTLFRNKFNTWKLSGTNYLNVVGNTSYTNSTNPALLPNILTWKNNYVSGMLSDISYYHTTKPTFISENYTWPTIGSQSGNGMLSNTNPAETRYVSGGQFTINKRDPIAGYSIKNTGLITGMNASDNSVYNRNKGELSIGSVEYYTNLNGMWDVGPVTTFILPNGHEEIISSYNSTGSATAYISSNKNADGQTLIFNKPNAVITALTSGDFNGDGVNEIVIAYNQNGLPYLYKSTDPANLLQTLIYSNTSVYWTINALASGDFNGDNKDELIIGLNSNGPNTAIYKSMDALSLGTIIYANNDGYWDIIALAAGDFDDDGKDELIEAFHSVDGSSLYKSMNADANMIALHSELSSWKIGAMAAGDFDNDGEDELITAFNSATRGPKIYKSESADKVDEVFIFNKANVYWTVKSLAIEKIHITAPGGKPAEIESLENPSSDENTMNIYPNPNKGIFSVVLDQENHEIYTIKVFDTYGRKIQEKTALTSSAEIDISSESPGVYLVIVVTRNGMLQNKIIIE